MSACPDCRAGFVCAEVWEAWYARRDDAELAGLAVSAELLEERPDVEEEVECPRCGGTGYLALRAA